MPANDVAKAAAGSIKVTSVKTSLDLKNLFTNVSPNYVKYTTTKLPQEKVDAEKEHPDCWVDVEPLLFCLAAVTGRLRMGKDTVINHQCGYDYVTFCIRKKRAVLFRSVLSPPGANSGSILRA